MPFSDNTIGIVTWDYAHPKGGLGRSVQWMTSALRSAGISVSVASPHVDHAHDRSLLRWTHSIPAGHLLFSLFLPLRLPSFLRRTKTKIFLFPCGPGGIFLWRRPKGIPVIAVAYHTYIDQARLVPGQRWKGIFIPFERRTYQSADHILCFSEDTARTLTNEYGIPPQRIHVLPHAIDTAAWSGGEQKEEGLCVCIARLERRKGVDVLLRAWPQVIAINPKAKLVIVGRGWEEKKIDRLIREAGTSVTRYASLPEQELKALVKRASIVLCPSYLEGFGLSCAEAMAAGALVIASDSPGLQSLVRQNETGLLVKTGDEKELADAIILGLSDAALRERLGRAAQKETVNRCNMDNANEMLVRTIADCFSGSTEETNNKKMIKYQAPISKI